MTGSDDSSGSGGADENPEAGTSTPVLALDASALMAPVEANVRLFEELDRLLGTYETVVPGSVLSELEGLASGAGTAATAASVGEDLATRARTVEVDDSEEAGEIDDGGDTYADDALVALARTGRVDYVVTNDRPLIERVLDADTPVICLRGRNTLAITEP
ncbi:rRNA-processing protein FCF1 [Halorubrum alkaliphilum]|uniref:rRNA-processing protein FCF1 n=1 Tax=Halorubrum alkaliphilum TaxID=261290 RepID=A0A8T4GDW0_9EURY|nr:twitching motility protein PilT [Halorubrum alkaliphilum]MBP1922674.1 rRNA-processing protein FCF1 [Halorubrum alkaliphilum]